MVINNLYSVGNNVHLFGTHHFIPIETWKNGMDRVWKIFDRCDVFSAETDISKLDNRVSNTKNIYDTIIDKLIELNFVNLDSSMFNAAIDRHKKAVGLVPLAIHKKAINDMVNVVQELNKESINQKVERMVKGIIKTAGQWESGNIITRGKITQRDILMAKSIYEYIFDENHKYFVACGFSHIMPILDELSRHSVEFKRC